MSWIDRDDKFYPAALTCIFISALLIAFCVFMPSAHADDRPGDCFGHVECRFQFGARFCQDEKLICLMDRSDRPVTCWMKPIKN